MGKPLFRHTIFKIIGSRTITILLFYLTPARSRGGGGGSDDPPQLPIPKILFHPLAILFHPWNVDDVTRAMSTGGGGGGACECPRVGAFFKLMTSRGQCPREGGGGCAWCSTHPSSDPPPTTWLAGYGPVTICRPTIKNMWIL